MDKFFLSARIHQTALNLGFTCHRSGASKTIAKRKDETVYQIYCQEGRSMNTS